MFQKVVRVLFVFLFLSLSINTHAAALIGKNSPDTARVALKTNLVEWAFATPNLAAEVRLADRWSLELSGALIPYGFKNDVAWKHWQTTMEARYWFHHALDGHFLGLHVGGGEYNLSRLSIPLWGFEKDYRYEGWNVRVGLSYGYAFRISRHFSIEALVGLGAVYTDYTQFRCYECGERLTEQGKWMFAPTRASVSLLIDLGRRKHAAASAIKTDTLLLTRIERDTLLIRDTVTVDRAVVMTTQLPKEEIIKQAYPFLRQEGQDTASRRGLSIRFRLNRHDIDRTYSQNREQIQLLEDAIRTLKESDDFSLTRISIIGYASPEGYLSENKKLSKRRAEALGHFIIDSLGVDEQYLTMEGGGEDWEGLRELVVESDMVGMKQVLQIIDSIPYAERKQYLMKLKNGRTWHSMRDVLFPQLRDACYINVWFRKRE